MVPMVPMVPMVMVANEDREGAEPTAALPSIPFVDAGDGGVRAILAAHSERFHALLVAARRSYPAFLFAAGDRVARRWLLRHANPYRAEIEARADSADLPGVVLEPGVATVDRLEVKIAADPLAGGLVENLVVTPRAAAQGR